MKKFTSTLFDDMLNDSQRAALTRLGFTSKMESREDGEYTVYEVVWRREVEAASWEEFWEWERTEVYSLPEFQEGEERDEKKPEYFALCPGGVCRVNGPACETCVSLTDGTCTGLDPRCDLNH